MFGQALWALSAARIKQFLREPGSLFWTFGFPLLITVALGTAFRNQGPSKSHVAVIAGPGSELASAALAADRAIETAILDPTRAARQLGTGEVVLVVVPPASPGLPFVYRDETAVARGARYVDWLVPGLLGMQLLNGAMWGASFNIVNARQRKLLKRLAATPMRRSHYLLSFRVSGLLFVPLQVIVLFAFARLTFGVIIHGSAVAALGLALLGSWSFAGLGLLCASRAQNSETANGLINVVTLPMMVLSGVFFSSSRFPKVMQPAIRLLPMSAFNEALRNVVNDGASIFSQGYPIAVLAGWALITSFLAVRIFRWT
jgi:ABC-type multidrug transport system permease subunit